MLTDSIVEPPNLIKPFDFQKFNELFHSRYPNIPKADVMAFKRKVLQEVKTGENSDPITLDKQGKLVDGYARLLCYNLLGIEPPVKVSEN